MIWKDYSKLRGTHSILSASQHAWLNDTKDSILIRYQNDRARKFGTYLHDQAAKDILFGEKTGIMRPANGRTYETYVNDAIKYRMRPEEVLYYGPYAYVTADTLCFRKVKGKDLLRIHDLKTGKVPADIVQLEVYAAYFCLMYGKKPSDINIELRIYQNNEIFVKNPEVNDIVPIMDKIVFLSKVLESSNLEEL